MLLERYLIKHAQSLPEPFRPALSDVTAVRQLARLRRVVCVGASVFEAPHSVLSRYFALQDQTLEQKQHVLQIAGSIASRQRDRSARALTAAVREAGLPLREPEVEQEDTVLLARLDRTWYLLGDESAMEAEGVELGVTSQTIAAQMESEGSRVLFLAQKQPKRLLGIFAITDPVLPDAPIAVRRLRELGIELVLLTVEKTRVATGIAGQLGIDLLRSELDQAEKERVLASLMEGEHNAAVLSDASHYLQTPESTFVILVDNRSVASAGVVISSIAQLPDLVIAARTIATRARHRFFWINV
jgi:hypothetical protein